VSADEEIVRTAFHPERLAWLLSQMDEGEQEQFRIGLREPLHALVDAFTTPTPVTDALGVVLTELLTYLDSWVLSVRLSRNPGWQDDMSRTAFSIDSGTADVATIDDLRKLLA
jgi:hypothetical protein